MLRIGSPFRALALETLEGRDVPSTLQIVFDYRFDTLGFFNDPARREALEHAGHGISEWLNATVDLAPITPGGGNTWTATTFHPSDPNQQVRVPNLTVGTDQIVVFVGGGGGRSGEAALGGSGGYSASGTQAWFDTLRTRGRPGVAPWGGSIAFDRTTNWSADGTPAANETDLYTVASHELGHVLGFGISNQWNGLVSGNQFTGSHSREENGGANPHVTTGHWHPGVTSHGAPASMQPYVQAGTRVAFSPLDFAALADMGWEVSPPAHHSPPPVSTPIPTAPQLSNVSPLVVGGSDGTFQVFSVTAGGLTEVGGPVAPFPGFDGSVRVTSGDFDGDGVKDIVAAAGPGGGPHVRIFSGRTGQEVQSFFAYEERFRGGMFVAAGDFNGDGRDDLVVGADEGGGPRVRVFANGSPSAEMVDFYAIADENFRGGVRVAAGDMNGDGRDELVVAAGPGGGPRVAVYDGKTIGWGFPQRLVWDFYAYAPTVQNGAYVAVGDYDGDGRADIAFGPGSGSAHLKVISGRTLSTAGSDAALDNPLVSTIYPQAGGYSGGARVAAADYTGDGRVDIVTATGRGVGGLLTVRSLLGEFTTPVFGGSMQRLGLTVG